MKLSNCKLSEDQFSTGSIFQYITVSYGFEICVSNFMENIMRKVKVTHARTYDVILTHMTTCDVVSFT